MMNHKEIRKWLYLNHRYLKGPIILLIIMSSILSFTAVLFAFLSKRVVDAAQFRDTNLFVQASLFLFILLIFQILFKTLNQYLNAFYKAKAIKQLKATLYNDMLRKEYPLIKGYHTGALMNYLDSDALRISEGVITIIPRFFFLILRFIFAFILLMIIDYVFASVMILFGIFLFLGSLLVRKEMKKRHTIMQDKEALLRSYTQESLEHIMLIKSFQAEDYSNVKLEENQFTYMRAYLSKQKLGVIATSLLQGIFTIGYVIALIYGAYQIGVNALTFGSLIAIIQLVEFMQSPFSGLSALMPAYYEMLASSERIMHFLDGNNENQVTPSIDSFESIRFNHVSFAYDNINVLSNFNTTIKLKAFVHIKGISGIGKTTIFKLLLGLERPQEGELLLTLEDKTVQVSHETRSLFTYVPQGLMILSGTIKDNIIFNQENVSEEALIHATKIAEIYDDIMALPLGFDTAIKERGQGLSEGQLQRLALARALIKDAEVLLLDEVTSALDESTELKVLNNIKALTNKTCLIISHRPLSSDLIDQTIEL
jgi:ATP-binding cassette subfamily B protein